MFPAILNGKQEVRKGHVNMGIFFQNHCGLQLPGHTQLIVLKFT